MQARGRGLRRPEGRRTFRSKEFARDVQFFASNNDNLLAVQQLLGNNAGQPAKQMALAIDDDL